MRAKSSLSLIFTLFCISILFISCSIQEVEFKELKNVKMLKFSKDLMEAEVTAVIKNPNWFGFRVKGNDLDFYMNNNRVGKARIVRGFRVEGNSEKTYTFKVKAIPEVDNILGNALSMIPGMGSKKNSMGIKGDLKVTVLGFSTNYKVNLTEYIN